MRSKTRMIRVRQLSAAVISIVRAQFVNDDDNKNKKNKSSTRRACKYDSAHLSACRMLGEHKCIIMKKV